MTSLALKQDNESGGTRCWSEMLEREDKEVRLSLQMEEGMSSQMSDQPAPSAQENPPASYNEISLWVVLYLTACVVPVFHQHADNLQNWTQQCVFMPG